MRRIGAWFRGNWWAVAALLPVLAIGVWLSPDDSVEVWRTAEPRVAITPEEGGWAEYGTSWVRLAEFEPADLRDDFSGEPYPVPPGLQAWLARVTVQEPPGPEDESLAVEAADADLLSCEFLLEDTGGRRYGDAPDELSGAEIGPEGEYFSRTTCEPPFDGEGVTEVGGMVEYEVVALFVMPESATPAALLLTAFNQLPDYVRFPLDPPA